MADKRLVLATNNKHKVTEISDILKGLNIEILSAADFDDFPEVQETGTTLAENAMLKAMAVWEKYHLPCCADDTGLEVEYLDGAPGVYAARFAGEGCSFADNNRKLLGLLEGVPEEKRGAVFKTVIAFVDTAGQVHLAEGVLEGKIGIEMKGENGFGYDPVFMIGDRALAQMRPEEKNSISHRHRALEKIRPIIVKAYAELS